MHTGAAMHLGHNHFMLSSQIAITMEPGPYSSNPSSEDLAADIKTQQANILRKIDAITRAAGVKSPRRYETRQLQQKYNDLVDKRARVKPSPFSDPIGRLPPELWPDIIEPLLDVEYPVDILLDLTSVSRMWCTALVSSPRLWRTIVFDDGRQDYLAKAVMGLSLSGSCKLNVYLGPSLASWKEAVLFVLLESKRTEFLSMSQLSLSHAQEILAQIQEMPILKTLCLPRDWARDLEDKDLEMLGLERMPSIQSLIGTPISIGSRLGEHWIISVSINTLELMRGIIERCQQLPNLRALFIEMPAPDVALETLKVQLFSVEYATYTGFGFSRIASWFGPRLTKLDLDTTSFASLEELAISLGQFPYLHSLRLGVDSFSSGHNAQTQPTILRSIKSLTVVLSFPTPDTAPDTRDIATEGGFLCEALVAMVPCVEVLKIAYGTLTSVCCLCIGDLTNLVELALTYCTLAGYVPINAKNLESISCTVESSVLFATVVAPALRSLVIGGGDYSPPSDNKGTDTPSCPVSGETISKILALTLFVDTPIRWEFVSLSSLKELNLTHQFGGSSSVSSDVLEAILMRPFDLPALEIIKLPGRFFEWDVLLHMLERRVLYSYLGISHINTLIISHDLPYKLLRPITALLGGKLPERCPDDQFSLKSTKERICNEKMTGCYRCCFAFLHCDELPVHQNPQWRETPGACLEHFEVAYEIPSEYLTAEPPLQPGLAEWLSGKFTRRRELARGDKDFSKQFYRPYSCEWYSRIVNPNVIITSHSLGGTHFQQGYEEG